MNEPIHKASESENAFISSKEAAMAPNNRTMSIFQFQDNRPETTRQQRVKKIADAYAISHRFQAKQIHNESEVIQRSETGLANKKQVDVNVDAYLGSDNTIEGIVKSINIFLLNEKVPPVDFEITEKVVSGAQFYFQEWKIQFSESDLKVANFESHEYKDQLFALAYHEARHAEQIFRIARLLAKKGKDAQAIKEELTIPEKIAEDAVKHVLPKGEPTIEEQEAQSWHESIYGDGGNKRTKVLEDYQHVLRNEQWLETLSEEQLWYQIDDYDGQPKYKDGNIEEFKKNAREYFKAIDACAKDNIVEKYLGKLEKIHTSELGTQLYNIHYYLTYIKDNYRVQLAAIIKFLRSKEVMIDGEKIGDWDYERTCKSNEILDPFYSEIEGLRSKKEHFIKEYKELVEEQDAYDTQAKVEAALAKSREKK